VVREKKGERKGQSDSSFLGGKKEPGKGGDPEARGKGKKKKKRFMLLPRKKERKKKKRKETDSL